MRGENCIEASVKVIRRIANTIETTVMIEPAIAAEELFHAPGLTTHLGSTLHELADLAPTTLALMHGASYRGDGAAQLRGLADGYEAMAGASLR